MNSYSTEELKGLAAEGLTYGEIAEELGVGYKSVESALKRRGIRVTREANRSVRQKVQYMKPRQALEYALDFIDEAFGSLAGKSHPVDEYDLSLSRLGRRVFIALYDANRVPLTKDQIYRAMYFDRVGDGPEDKLVDIYVCKVRKALRGSPFKIVTLHSYGYRLEKGVVT